VDERNPYAPSPASLGAKDASRRLDREGPLFWRDGNVLVAVPDSSLPKRCVKCNATSAPPTKARYVYWCHPALYALLLINVIVFGVVVLMVRRRAIVLPGLCARHQKRHRHAVRLAWIGVLFGLVLLYVGAASPLGLWRMLLGMLIVLGSIVAGMLFARVVYAKRIDKIYVRLKGCGDPFLDSLPPFTG
jgi:hypothetical protein